MNKTSIEWVKNPDSSQGYTWNPITGCLNGCSYCYARRLANGRLKPLYLANKNLAPGAQGGVAKLSVGDKSAITREGDYADPFYPRFWPERLIEPMNKYRRWGKHSSVKHEQSPKGIFVCDMSDLFGIGTPEEWTQKVMDAISKCPQHRFYLLTKQPQNLAKFSPFPENCWVGVTATNMHMLADACYMLKRVQAKVKYISVEPFLDFNRTDDLLAWNIDTALFEAGIGWLIIGAQTKPYKPPQSEWIRDILSATKHTGTLIFLKDNLYMIKPKRQEMPNIKET